MIVAAHPGSGAENLWQSVVIRKVSFSDSFSLANARRGDTVDIMLCYVGCQTDNLRTAFQCKINAAHFDFMQTERLAIALEADFTAYTSPEKIESVKRPTESV